MATPPERQKVYFARWYAKNKQELAAKRKERYHEDPEYRERLLSRERGYRKGRAQSTKPKPKKVITPDTEQRWRVAAAAELLGFTTARIKYWERKGWIPKSITSEGSAHRYYTAGQIELMRKLGELLDSGEAGADEVSLMVEEITREW